MKLYLIRHLPTPWNEKGVLQGSNDIAISPLTPTWQTAIQENLDRIQAVHFDAVLVSAYQRTQQTAEAYGHHDYQVEALLNELNFGTFEGQKKQLMVDTLGAAWMERPRSLTLGEPIIDFEKRLMDFIASYAHHENILAFAHGRVIRALLAIHKYGDVERMNHFEVENNELLYLDFNHFHEKK